MPGFPDLSGLLAQHPLPGVGLTPGAPAAMPQAPMAQGAPMPQIQTPKLPLYMRLLRGLFPTSPVAQGLLTPDEIEQQQWQGLMRAGAAMSAASAPHTGPATPLMSIIGQGIGAGQDYTRQALDAASQSALFQQQLDEQQRMKARRERIAQTTAPKPGETPEQRMERIIQMYDEFLRAGDVESASALNPAVQQILAARRANEDNTEWVDEGGTKTLRDKRTGQVIMRVQKTPNPRDPNSPDTAEMLRMQRRFNIENGFRDDFNKEYLPARGLAFKIKGALNEVPNAIKGDGASQVNLLYAFVSAMDPQSAVREGEIGLVQSASSLVSQAKGVIQKYVEGKPVLIPPGMVQQIAGLMRRRYETLKEFTDDRRNYYSEQAKKFGVDDSVFQTLPPLGGAAAPSVSGGKGQAGNVDRWLK